jgi:hypothetical protein
MIAHLQDGRYGDSQILKPETARQMRETAFTHDPTLPGMAYGFMRMKFNGEEIIEHGGDTFFFHSHFVMLPQRNSGYFVSYNTDTGGGVREKLLKALFDRYYPATDATASNGQKSDSTSLARYAGRYGAIRHSYTSIAKLGALFGVAKVEADGDELLVSNGASGRRFVEVTPLVFREVDGQSTLAFREDPQGRITHLFASNSPSVALVRLGLTETPWFHIFLIVGCIALCISGLVGWPVVAIATRGTHPQTAGPRRARLLGWITCLLIVALVGLGMIPLSNPEELGFAVTPLVAALLWCMPLLALLVAGMLVCTALAWKDHYWRLPGRLYYTVVLVAAVAFLWFLYQWNLLRFMA